MLVHGAGLQVERLARASRQTPSNIDGTGVTDAATLDLALTAANRVTHDMLTGLTGVDIRAAASNAVVAHPAGILQGVDHQFTGRIERVDLGLLQSLLERDIVPVVPPLGCDGEGHTYRLNSDVVAAEMAVALKAVKLIYLSAADGIARDGEPIRQLSIEEAELFLRQHGSGTGRRPSLEAGCRRFGPRQGGVPRVHLIDGRVEEGLLTEVFSYQGIGTLVYANEYQAIRPAQKKDVRAIHALIQHGVRTEELLPRSRSEIEQTDQRFLRVRGGSFARRLRRSALLSRCEPGGGRLPVRRGPVHEPGHRRQAVALRRRESRGAWASSSCSAYRRKRSISSARRAAFIRERPRICRRLVAKSTSGAAGNRS